jgi:hypothetical protein
LQCRYTDVIILSSVNLSIIMLSVIMFYVVTTSVIMLIAIMLNVVAPSKLPKAMARSKLSAAYIPMNDSCSILETPAF